MTTPEVSAGSVCSGYGGLDLAAADVFGAHTLWFADNEPAAAAVLAHHWPHIPNLGDIRTVDWTTVAPVELLTGGTPCQDLSAAGKRAGLTRGTRSGVWHSMCDAVEQLRPMLVLWENVRGALSAKADSAVEPCPRCLGNDGNRRVLRALGRVLGDLADLGYDATWCSVPAAAVGCAHLRWRIFVAAVDTRRRNWPAELAELTFGRPAPDPTIVGMRGQPKLSPYFTEWLMGLPLGHVTGVPGLTANQQLKLCGNGVVIAQAAAAFRWLAARLLDTVADCSDCPDCDGCQDTG